jgi:hypothetical protein
MPREGIGSRRYVNSLVQVRWSELQVKWEAVSYSWDSFYYQCQCRVLLDKGQRGMLLVKSKSSPGPCSSANCSDVGYNVEHAKKIILAQE